MTLRETIKQAIQGFDFGNYGFDVLDDETYSDEWLTDLVDAIATDIEAPQ